MSSFSRLAGLHARGDLCFCGSEIRFTPTRGMEPAPHAQNLVVLAPVLPTLPATHPEHKKPSERPKRSPHRVK